LLRNVTLWICGLFAFAVVGALIADYLYGSNGDVWGVLVGMAIFACARRWATERRKEH
jgi:hypothetical protein